MNGQSQLNLLVTNQPAPRACVFINSINNPMTQKVIENSQLITLPFPPTINPHDLVVPRSDGHISRPPNNFMIYRKLFFETARAAGYKLPMSIISSMASKSWEHESDNVKKVYRKIAREAFDYYNEIFPKTKPKKKRDQWRNVPFDKFIHKTKIPKSLKSVNNDKSVKPSNFEIALNTDLSSPEMPNDLNDINSPKLNPDFFVDRTDLFDNQNVYPNPNIFMTPSNNSSSGINKESEFNSESLSAQYFDIPIQIDQQIICHFMDDDINDTLFVNTLGFSNEIPETNSSGIFDTQNTCILDNFINFNNSNEMNEMSYEHLPFTFY
ncbi:14962_t:CDS:1 [Cetraspora pellucida]|uniref:14962_t:CDS:1 n=1 Tax=Cetraspora pellucida TaxID=1433469 RepID=A0A9N9H5L6_9GLOM|nr:14962_t:CDS:1 [Cetraspora pellucida]